MYIYIYIYTHTHLMSYFKGIYMFVGVCGHIRGGHSECVMSFWWVQVVLRCTEEPLGMVRFL